MGETKNTLYSTGCPKCNVLKKKLDEAGIEYDVVDDQDLMISMGFKSVPVLRVGEKDYDFSEAVAWIRSM